MVKEPPSPSGWNWILGITAAAISSIIVLTINLFVTANNDDSKAIALMLQKQAEMQASMKALESSTVLGFANVREIVTMQLNVQSGRYDERITAMASRYEEKFQIIENNIDECQRKVTDIADVIWLGKPAAKKSK